MALLVKMYLSPGYNDMDFWTSSWTGSNDYIEVVFCHIEEEFLVAYVKFYFWSWYMDMVSGLVIGIDHIVRIMVFWSSALFLMMGLW